MTSCDISIGCEWSRVRFPESPSPETLRSTFCEPFCGLGPSSRTPGGLRPPVALAGCPRRSLPCLILTPNTFSQPPPTSQLAESPGGCRPPEPPRPFAHACQPSFFRSKSRLHQDAVGFILVRMRRKKGARNLACRPCSANSFENLESLEVQFDVI